MSQCSGKHIFDPFLIILIPKDAFLSLFGTFWGPRTAPAELPPAHAGPQLNGCSVVKTHENVLKATTSSVGASQGTQQPFSLPFWIIRPACSAKGPKKPQRMGLSGV